MMNISSLLNRSRRVNQDFKRNIVDAQPVSSAFSLLIDDDDSIEDVEAIIRNTRRRSIQNNAIDDFYYTAVEYPFKTEPYMVSRYSDGTFPVWYGSKNLETTIHETVFHTKKWLQGIGGIEEEKVVIKNRAVFDVFCDSILLDITDNTEYYANLTSDNYDFTNSIAQEVYRLDMSGILTPSARLSGGINAAIYKQSTLKDPRLNTKLRYEYDALKNIITVRGKDGLLMTI